MGTLWLMKSFLVLIVGGLRQHPRHDRRCERDGLAGAASRRRASEQIHWPPLVLAQVIVFALAIILILLRPQGLLGGVSQRED